MNKEYSKYLEAAIEMARGAGEIHLRHFRKGGLDMQTKLNLFDVVTVADKESEAYIKSRIHELFPGHGIIAEESGDENAGREWRWVIDPLDGTTNFSQGLPAFCCSIALEHHGEAVAGVVYAPYLGELFRAVKGGGAYLNDAEIHCSMKSEAARSVLATGVPYDKNENPDNNLREIMDVVPHVRAIRRMGSAAIDLCYTAAGFFDAYWELNLNRWDIAAGRLIALEAGATVEDIRTDRRFSLLVSSPNLVAKMRELLSLD